MNTWQTIVLELEGRGWSLTAIARATGASIGAISDLKQGRTKEPRANVAIALNTMHITKVAPPGARAANDDTAEAA